MFDVRWDYSDNGQMYFKTTWADSAAGFASLVTGPADDVPMNLFPEGPPPGLGLPNPGEDDNLADLEYHDYDFSQVNTYSDLRYTEVRATVGLTHKLTSFMEVFGSASIFDVDDKDPYLESLSGRVALYVAGLNWTF
jgi:hypothetical protein